MSSHRGHATQIQFKIMEQPDYQQKSAARCQNRYGNTKAQYQTESCRGPTKAELSVLGLSGIDVVGENSQLCHLVPFDDTYLRLRESTGDVAAASNWDYWPRYEEYYERRPNS